METLDERVAHLEGRVEEHSGNFAELRESIRQVDGHVQALDRKVDRLIGAVNVRIDGLDNKLTSQFLWTVGIQIAVLLAVIGALARP